MDLQKYKKNVIGIVFSIYYTNHQQNRLFLRDYSHYMFIQVYLL